MAGLNTLYFQISHVVVADIQRKQYNCRAVVPMLLVCLRFLFGEYLRLHKFFCYVQCILQLKTMSASYGQSGN